MAALGCALLDKAACDMMLDRLTDEMFYHEPHRHIFTAISVVRANGLDVDFNTVGERLQAAGVLGEAGGRIYMTDLIDRVATTAHVESYVKIVHEKYGLRTLIDISVATVRTCGTATGLNDVLIKVEEQLDEVAAAWRAHALAQTPRDMLAAIIEHIREERRMRKSGDWRPLTWGLHTLDRWMELRPGALYMIVGDSSHLKSSLLVHTVASLAVDRKCMVMPFEEGQDDWTLKLLSRMANVPIDLAIRAEEMTAADENRLKDAEHALKTYDTLIAPDLRTIRSTRDLHQQIQQHRPEVVVIDYLQIFPDDRNLGGPVQRVDTVAEELQRLAATERITILMASSINRHAKDAQDRPTKTSIRNSHAAVHANHGILGVFYSCKVDATQRADRVHLSVLKHKTTGTTPWTEFHVEPSTSFFTDPYAHNTILDAPAKRERVPF